MKKVMKLKLMVFVLASLFAANTFGQKNFSIDSLAGFDEAAAKKAALSEGFFGSEFTVRMSALKRTYINSKYNLKVHKTPIFKSPIYTAKTAAPQCNNEDFESPNQAPNTITPITSANQIAGWTVEGGTNFSPDNSCNLNGCCPNPPSESALITAPGTGFVDPVIG